MKYIQSQQSDWSKILKMQDQFSKQQDQKRKQQEKLHKQLLKQQLETMIKQNYARSKQHSLEDAQVIKYNQQQMKVIFCLQKSQTIKALQNQHEQKKQSIRLKFSKDNYHHSLESKLKRKQQIHQEKTFYTHRFHKLSAQLNEEKQRSKRTYSLKQHQLALAYDQQLQYENNRRLSQKYEDIKFQTLAKHIQDQREKQRTDKLNKIRFGYGQNQNVFIAHNQLQQKRQKQRENLVDSFANSQTKLDLISQQKNDSEKEKIRMKKQASMFNRQQFQQKYYRKRMENLKQTLQEQSKFDTIQQLLQEEKRLKSLQKQNQRKLLQHELEKQIKQAQQQKRQTRFMNPQEYRINHTLLNNDRIHSAAFPPGVAYDYKVEKQKILIQKFLGGQSKNQSSPSYFHSFK